MGTLRILRLNIDIKFWFRTRLKIIEKLPLKLYLLCIFNKYYFNIPVVYFTRVAKTVKTRAWVVKSLKTSGSSRMLLSLETDTRPLRSYEYFFGINHNRQRKYINKTYFSSIWIVIAIRWTISDTIWRCRAIIFNDLLIKWEVSDSLNR